MSVPLLMLVGVAVLLALLLGLAVVVRAILRDGRRLRPVYVITTAH